MNDWIPQPKQVKALTTNAFEIFFGGSRGGGKTDVGMVFLLGDRYDKDKYYIHHPEYRALVLRRDGVDLTDWLDRAERMYETLGGKKVGNPPAIKFPSGATIRTGHLKDRRSYEKYLGHEYARILIEELTLIPLETHYERILGSCRTTIPNFKPQIMANANPGSVGHLWVKERFIDPAPPETKFINPKTNRNTIFIPSTIDDNPQLMNKDPDYVKFLDGLKNSDEKLYKAWRHGDWDVFVGQVFSEFDRKRHTIKAVTPSNKFERRGGMDWGYTNPWVFLGAVVYEVKEEDAEFNRVVLYREVDGTKMTPREVGEAIIEREPQLSIYERISLDPAMFNKGQDGSQSIAKQIGEVLGDNAYKLKPANNDRIGGWAVLHNWLSIAPDGLPYLLICENCVNTIKTLPALVYDAIKVEDVDTNGPDHWADALRYLLMDIVFIDGNNVGSFGSTKKQKPKQETAEMINGRQVGVNLDEFGKINKRARNWKVI